jgi:hypothetical protein
MFKYLFDKRPVVESSQRISASVFVRNSYFSLWRNTVNDKKRQELDLNDEEFVKKLLGKIEAETRLNLKQEINNNYEYTKPNKVRLTYTKSNLGRGFVFWFVCQVCGRRVRYLYIPPNSEVSACRQCHRLAYERQNESKRFRDLSSLYKRYPTL